MACETNDWQDVSQPLTLCYYSSDAGRVIFEQAMRQIESAKVDNLVEKCIGELKLVDFNRETLAANRQTYLAGLRSLNIPPLEPFARLKETPPSIRVAFLCVGLFCFPFHFLKCLVWVF